MFFAPNKESSFVFKNRIQRIISLLKHERATMENIFFLNCSHIYVIECHSFILLKQMFNESDFDGPKNLSLPLIRFLYFTSDTFISAPIVH